MSKNPVDEFLEKKASFGNVARDFGSRAGEAAMTGGATAVGAAGVAVIGLAASKIYDAATKGRDFRRMLQHNPEVAEAHARDPKGVSMMFSSLRTMNPHFSSDPLVAGNYMKQMTGTPDMAGQIATQAAHERPDDKNSLLNTFVGAGSRGAKPDSSRSTSRRKYDETLASEEAKHDYEQVRHQYRAGP